MEETKEVVIKPKKKKVNKSFRKKTETLQENGPLEEELNVGINEIREIQKQRAEMRPSKGLTVATIAEQSTSSKPKNETGRGLSVEFIGRAEQLKADLNSQFISQKEGNVEDALMNNYIETKLAEKRRLESLAVMEAARAKELNAILDSKRKQENDEKSDSKKMRV